MPEKANPPHIPTRASLASAPEACSSVFGMLLRGVFVLIVLWRIDIDQHKARSFGTGLVNPYDAELVRRTGAEFVMIGRE
jgi:hypothetical protein